MNRNEINMNHVNRVNWGRLVVSGVAGLLALLLQATAAWGQDKPVASMVEGLPSDGRLTLMVNRSAVLTTKVPYKRVSIAQAEIADVNALNPSTILVTAKKAGNTQLIIWDDADRSQVVDVGVQVDLNALKDHVKAMFPDSAIGVTSVNGTIALRGNVPSLQVAEQVVQVSEPYGSKVLNFLEVSGGQQVMLQVRFAEVSRSAISQLGVNMGYTDGVSSGASNIGQIAPFRAGEGGPESILTPDGGPAVTLFGGTTLGSTAFRFFLAALRENNLMRVLAEPNLIAISGQEATFLAGGEFPIPVPQTGGAGSSGTTITIEYKEFGVRLRFVPVVLGDGRIRLRVEPEVSDLDFTKSVSVGGFPVPGLRTRRVATTIEMIEGQTFAIAGLLDNTTFGRKESTPLLGDVPVLGALFRSVRYERRETELVVLVTPQLVEALNPGQVPALPGERWRHPSETELFLNRDLGGPAADTKHAPATQPVAAGEAPLFQGRFGFVATETESAWGE